jgi:hypothetical protein
MKAEHATSHADNQPKEAVAYAQLLSMAHEEGLKSIATQLVIVPNDENGRLAIVKATVEVEKGHFEGLGDADPSSVEAFLAPHLIRVAETRAKARALRDAVNCGIVSFEELDGVRPNASGRDPGSGAPVPARRTSTRTGNGSAPRGTPTGNGQDGQMSEAQRRYLFRILAGQGYQREAAEERLKDLFEVSALAEITKVAATKMIDQLLASAPGNGGGGRGADSHHQR